MAETLFIWEDIMANTKKHEHMWHQAPNLKSENVTK